MDHRSSTNSYLNTEPLRIEHPDEPITIQERFDRPLRPGWYRIEARFGPEGLVDCLVELSFESGHFELRRMPAADRNSFGCVARVPKGIVGVTFYLAGSQPAHRTGKLVFRATPAALRFGALLARAIRVARDEPMGLWSRVVRFGLRLWRQDLTVVPVRARISRVGDAYNQWCGMFDEEPVRDRELHEARLARIPHAPMVSVLCVLDKPEDAVACSRMVETTIYSNWELVLVTDSTEEAEAALSKARVHQAQIKVCATRTPDRGASFNAGLAAVSGDFVIPLETGVRLRENALLEFALALRRAPSARLIYADEDELSGGVRQNPRFKPAWSPEMFATHDYMGDPVLIQTDAVRQIGGWRPHLGDDAWYDLKLRLTEGVGAGAIVHLAKLLAHRSGRRIARAKATPNRRRIIEEHLGRKGLTARVVGDERSPHPRIEHAVPKTPPLVSILMPTKDKAQLLRRAVDTLLNVTRYSQFELLVIDNGSHESETLDVFRSWDGTARIRVVPSPGPFNFSALNNAAARIAAGEILVMLNNDVEIVDPGWLHELIGHASRPEVGCVGAKLYYPDGSLQHAGVMTGPSGGAGHGHKHAPPGATGYLDRLVTVTNVSAVTAACLAVRAEVYRTVGGFDEVAFPVAFNDVDFCLRVAAAGYRNVWTPFAELVHHESVSRGTDTTPESARRFAGELQALQRRWSVRLLRDPYYSPHLTMDGEDYGFRTR